MSDHSLNRRHFVKWAAATGTALSTPNLFAQAPPPAGPFTLSPLPYAFDALEPHIDAKTMEIHHGKHHQAYVNNLNTAVTADTTLKGQSIEDLVTKLPSISNEATRNTVRNNGGGHWNHDFFWKSLAPATKSGKPSADLANAINASFGSFDDFKKTFGEAATKRFGSGWAWLIVQNGKLKITSTPNQDNPLMKGIVPDADLGTPLLGLDVWEHAYYLHYQNRRPDYITAFWNIVDWTAVSSRLKG